MTKSWKPVPYRADAAAHRGRGDMRDAKRVVCNGCSYEWWAPVIGRCPRCKSESHRTVLEQHLDIKRV